MRLSYRKKTQRLAIQGSAKDMLSVSFMPSLELMNVVREVEGRVAPPNR